MNPTFPALDSPQEPGMASDLFLAYTIAGTCPELPPKTISLASQ